MHDSGSPDALNQTEANGWTRLSARGDAAMSAAAPLQRAAQAPRGRSTPGGVRYQTEKTRGKFMCVYDIACVWYMHAACVLNCI